MTVGQRIQRYRKLQDLSQEELAMKLLVSRQTISLWENDQTLPTIDNLVRLKEIFGVSIDEILCQQEETADAPAPLEQYVFTYTAQEDERIRRLVQRNYIKKVTFACGMMVLSWLLLTGWENFLSILLGVVVSYILLLTVFLRRHKKVWRKRREDLLSRVYHYDVYADHLDFHARQEGQTVKLQKIPLAEMKLFADTEDMLLYVFEQKLLLFPKAQLPTDSLLRKVGRRPMRASAGLEIAAKILLWASIGLAVAATAWFFHLSWDIELLAAKIWYCFLALPVPIAAIVLGLILKVKGGKGVRGVVAGVIVSALLLFFGSLSVIFGAFNFDIMEPTPNPPYIGTIEAYTGIDLPEHSSIHTMDYRESPYPQTWTTRYVYSTIFFDQRAVEEFENGLASDPRWLREFPNALVGIMPENVYTKDCYILLYNIDLQQWNQVPPESGEYHMLFMVYDPMGNTMNVEEYRLKYTK